MRNACSKVLVRKQRRVSVYLSGRYPNRYLRSDSDTFQVKLEIAENGALHLHDSSSPISSWRKQRKILKIRRQRRLVGVRSDEEGELPIRAVLRNRRLWLPLQSGSYVAADYWGWSRCD